MTREKKEREFALNGISISSLSLNQEGELEVEFDLPVEQNSSLWHTSLKGSRTFDVYEDDKLQEICRQLFQAVRDRVTRPDPEREAIHCDRCSTSPCCRKYNVILRSSDLTRLAEGLGISVDGIRERYTVPAVDWCGEYERQLLADTDEDDEEKCVFLQKNGSNQWRCSVYEHRPQICRDFDMRSCDDFVPVEEIGKL